MKERMTERGEGKRWGEREVAASTAALSITLIQALIILFTHTYTHVVVRNCNILKDFEGNKRQNKETARPRQKTPGPDTPKTGTNRRKLIVHASEHTIRVVQTAYFNR